MAILAPGRRRRGHGKAFLPKRNPVAMLSLTAMVDMFTVLTIFLLQNYNTTGEVIHIPKEVQLPQASAVKELKPAHVIIITPKEIFLDDKPVARFVQVKEQKEWMVTGLFNRLVDAMKKDEEEYKKNLSTTLKNVVSGAKKQSPESVSDNFRKITLQADKQVDFLTIKKILYTVTEAGAGQINFAVIQKEKSSQSL